MNEMEKREKIIEYINGMSVDEKIALHNTYCDAANCMDDCIYEMNDLEAFDFTKEFWGFNGYGNIVSYDARELPVFASDIANYILSEKDSLGDDEIQEILDGDEELQELAAKIRAAKTWVEVEAELKALCEAAGMVDEYKAADGDNFEAVIYKAAERLGVEF